ncbi:hypothetical protein D3C76_1484410 [compost metagenome]
MHAGADLIDQPERKRLLSGEPAFSVDQVTQLDFVDVRRFCLVSRNDHLEGLVEHIGHPPQLFGVAFDPGVGVVNH